MNKIFNIITIYIIGLLIIGITGTYLSDYLNDVNWFGDTVLGGGKCLATGEHTHYYDYGEKLFMKKGVCLYIKSSSKEWGARHLWYNWGVVILFLLSLSRGVAKVVQAIIEFEKVTK